MTSQEQFDINSKVAQVCGISVAVFSDQHGDRLILAGVEPMTEWNPVLNNLQAFKIQVQWCVQVKYDAPPLVTAQISRTDASYITSVALTTEEFDNIRKRETATRKAIVMAVALLWNPS